MNTPTLYVSKCCQSTHHTSIDLLSRARPPHNTTDTAFEAVTTITMTIIAEAATKNQSADLLNQRSVTVTTTKFLRVKASVRGPWLQLERQLASMRIVTTSRCARVSKSRKRRPKEEATCFKTEANKTETANPQNLLSQTRLPNSRDIQLNRIKTMSKSSHPGY